MSMVLLAVSVIAPIVLYGTGPSFLFWVAIINTISYLVVAFAIPNLIAMNSMKKFKTRIDRMEQDGASDEEIEKVFKEEPKIAEEDSEAVSSWVNLLGMANMVVALVLFIIGSIYRLY